VQTQIKSSKPTQVNHPPATLEQVRNQAGDQVEKLNIIYDRLCDIYHKMHINANGIGDLKSDSSGEESSGLVNDTSKHLSRSYDVIEYIREKLTQIEFAIAEQNPVPTQNVR